MDISGNLRKELQNNIGEKTKSFVQNFFKEKVKMLGVRTGTVTKISEKFYRELKNNPKKVFSICAKSFSSPVF